MIQLQVLQLCEAVRRRRFPARGSAQLHRAHSRSGCAGDAGAVPGLPALRSISASDLPQQRLLFSPCFARRGECWRRHLFFHTRPPQLLLTAAFHGAAASPGRQLGTPGHQRRIRGHSCWIWDWSSPRRGTRVAVGFSGSSAQPQQQQPPSDSAPAAASAAAESSVATAVGDPPPESPSPEQFTAAADSAAADSPHGSQPAL